MLYSALLISPSVLTLIPSLANLLWKPTLDFWELLVTKNNFLFKLRNFSSVCAALSISVSPFLHKCYYCFPKIRALSYQITPSQSKTKQSTEFNKFALEIGVSFFVWAKLLTLIECMSEYLTLEIISNSTRNYAQTCEKDNLK